MSYEERLQASLGPDYILYCPTCMREQEVYSAAGHKKDQMNLHCVVCAKFVARLIRASHGDGQNQTLDDNPNDWKLDYSGYKKGVKFR